VCVCGGGGDAAVSWCGFARVCAAVTPQVVCLSIPPRAPIARLTHTAATPCLGPACATASPAKQKAVEPVVDSSRYFVVKASALCYQGKLLQSCTDVCPPLHAGAVAAPSHRCRHCASLAP
jgi:hypothetical protein